MIRSTVVVYAVGLLLICLFAGLVLPGCQESLMKAKAEETKQEVDLRIITHPSFGVCLMKIPAGTNIGGYITKHDGIYMCNGVFNQMIADLTQAIKESLKSKSPKQYSELR